MRVLDTDRVGLLKTFQANEVDGRATPTAEREVGPIKEGEVRLLWRSTAREDDVPVAVVVREKEMGDFLAWTNTYLPNWSPITAYLRVISEANYWEVNEHVADIFGSSYELALVGLIVGEALIHSGAQHEVEQVPYGGCIATFSFVAARGARRGIAVEDLAERWELCRRVTGQDPLKTQVRELVVPWRVLVEVAKKETVASRNARTTGLKETLEDALADIVTTGMVKPVVWKDLTRGFPEVRNAMDYMSDTQEARMIAFERMLKETIKGKKVRSQEASFLAGYMASLIAPGSLKHACLLVDHVNRLPTAIMWLSLFASFHQKSQLRMSSLAHLVWRTMTEEEEVLSRPRCDIALTELCMLKDAGFFGDKVRVSTRGRLVVEIAPCVSTVVRWPRQESAGGVRDQGELFSVEAAELKNIANELEDLRGNLDKASRRLENWIAKRQ